MNFTLKSTLRTVGVVVAAVGAGGCVLFYDLPSTPIHAAAWKGDIEAIRALVKEGADINVPDALGGTPLYWAARGGHPVGPHRCRG
jgi:ankyrin repeat protein